MYTICFFFNAHLSWLPSLRHPLSCDFGFAGGSCCGAGFDCGADGSDCVAFDGSCYCCCYCWAFDLEKKKNERFHFRHWVLCCLFFLALIMFIHQVYNMYNNWYEATMKPPRRLLKLYQLPTRQNEFPTWSVATATPRFTCEAADGMNFHLRCGVSVYFKIYTPIFHLFYKKIYNSSK